LKRIKVRPSANFYALGFRDATSPSVLVQWGDIAAFPQNTSISISSQFFVIAPEQRTGAKNALAGKL
jgi:hypothetical protein